MIPVLDGYVADAKGRLVPENTVKPQLKLEDQLVRKIMGFADNLSGEISRFKGHTFDDVATYLQILAEEYGAKKGGAKGNMTFVTFDGLMKVQIQVADHLAFGPELQIAKGLIDECIVEWADGARDQIKVLVQHAFRTDREGQVSREAVLALRRVEIDDDRWRRAMQAITDSIRVLGSRQYVRFYKRTSAEAPWRAVIVDLAAAEPPAPAGGVA